MKLTKIIVSSLLVAAMAISMAACDSGDSETTTAVVGNNTTAATTTKATTTTAPNVDPTTPATTGGDDDDGLLPDEEVYGGMWYYDEETGHYLCYMHEGTSFAILPIGDGVVGEGVTKYSLEVTTTSWGQSPEWGIIYGGKDGDGDGFLTENFDWYWLALCNGSNIAHARSRDTFDKWDELAKEPLNQITEGEEVTLKVIVDISGKTVEFYLNDILIDTRNEEIGEVDFTEFGNMIGVCCKIDDAEFWDLKYTPIA